MKTNRTLKVAVGKVKKSSDTKSFAMIIEKASPSMGRSGCDDEP